MARGRWRLLFLALSYYGCLSTANDTKHTGEPLNIPASQFWDGDDGPWSTFRIGVGHEQQQQIRVLPASDQSSTWLVLPEACSTSHASTTDCADLRGGLYMRNESSTWKQFGQFELNTYLENRVGYSGDGLYGFDTLSLGWAGDGLPALDNQSIACIITDNFTIGSLALNARPINFTNYNNPIPSLLQNLRDATNSPIPSLSWSYTAGAYNLAPKVFGSLVLGGYDTTRFEPNDLVFPFGADISLDFQVAIQRITANNSNESLLSTPIVSYISTLVPDIWLPVDVCSAFLRAFQLSYDNSTQAFSISSSQHASNLASSPVVSFQVGPEATGKSITIDMPYFNFYLATRKEDANLTTNDGGFRFPIRCTDKDTQFILGRTFLQSAYLSTDYERNTFTLSQALYPSSSTRANIVQILPLGASSSNRLRTGAVIGISVGGAVITVIAAAVTTILHRRRKSKNTTVRELEDTDIQNLVCHEVHGNDMKPELGGGLQHELGSDEQPLEMTGIQLEIFELPAYEEKDLRGKGDVQDDVEVESIGERDRELEVEKEEAQENQERERT